MLNRIVFGPIVALIMVALSPLMMAVVCYDFWATCCMTAEDRKRYYMARLR